MTALVLHIGGQATALNHEAGNDPMKDCACEETFVGVSREVRHGNRRLLVEQLHCERAFGGFELQHGENAVMKVMK
jgi:hypothetical protein